MTPKEKNTDEKKAEMSQYNAAFNLYYDKVLQDLASYFYQNDITESDSKYGIAHYSIMRTLFDYIDEVVEGFQYTPEQLISLIEEHEMLKNKFEQKLIMQAAENQNKIENVMSGIESK